MDALTWLQNWYAQHCNGDWEHGYGIKIETLDNPGWRAQINLAETELESRTFQRLEIERSERDWIRCWVENNFFNWACGPLNLAEVIEVFRKWAS